MIWKSIYTVAPLFPSLPWGTGASLRLSHGPHSGLSGGAFQPSRGRWLGLRSATLWLISSDAKIPKVLVVRCGEDWEVGLMCFLSNSTAFGGSFVCVCVSLLSLSLVLMPTFSGRPPDSFLPVCLRALSLNSLCNCMTGTPSLCAGGAGDAGGGRQLVSWYQATTSPL